MTVNTNTLGSNSAEIVVTGPESWQNVITAVENFILTEGWKLVPNAAITTTATATNSANNQVTVSSSSSLAVGMPIIFGTSLGGIIAGTLYYVLTIPSGTTITVSTSNYVQNTAATAVTLSSATGTSTITSQINGAVSLTNNSTNIRQRVYYAPNLTGNVYKYMRINYMDLTLDTALQFSTTTTGGQSFYDPSGATGYTGSGSGNALSNRFNYYQHFSYPRDSYFYSTSSPTVGIQINLTPNFVFLDAGIYSSGGFGTITLATSQGYAFYPGQTLIAYSPSSGNYALATVSSWTETTGALVMNNPFFGTSNASSYTDWQLLNLAPSYNTPNNNNPAYIYISASARYCAIQFKNIDGVWNDWSAVCETENPLSLNNNWGLTTGYMISNTGYTQNVNGNQYHTYNTSATTRSYIVFGYRGSTQLAGSAAQKPSPITASGYFGRYVTYTGPFAPPATYKGRISSFASQSTKLITALGEVGFIGTTRKTFIQQDAPFSVNGVYLAVNDIALCYFKGLGDVIPTVTNTAGGAKHWATTPLAVTDYGDETQSFNSFAFANRLDTIENWNTSWAPFANTAGNIGPVGGLRDQSTYRTGQPTALGRIYGLKGVTTGLGTLNTISIKVDASGFTSSSGSSADHIVFSYPYQYTSPVLTVLRSTSTSNLPSGGNTNNLITRTITNTFGYQGSNVYPYIQGDVTYSGASGLDGLNSGSTFPYTFAHIGMPVTFTGTVFGGVQPNIQYWIVGYVGSAQQIGYIPGYLGSNVVQLTTASGSMTATYGTTFSETGIDQQAIRTSQSAAVAFPK